jgi:chromate reductase, NAD(P)H dehydrogenase (quinone)
VTAPKILAFAGSLRRDSLNKKLARVAADAARTAGGDVTLIDLKDLPMPVYDGDLEAAEGIPPNAKKLKELMKAHPGFLIASPEYNTSIPGMLKNVIDWTSRSEKGEPPLACFDGKVAGLLSASPGALGGVRGLLTLRATLSGIRVLVIPEQVSVPKADQAFGPDGKLLDPKLNAAVEKLAKRLVEVVAKLSA